MDNLNELFAVPVGLKPIPVFGSLKLFTSDSLKNSYVEAMGNISKMSSVHGKVSKLVEDGIIIPCFLTKGIISTILFKMLPTDKAKSADQEFREEYRHVFGFYDNLSKKIYVLIGNQINKYGVADNEKLASVTIHEAAHMAAVKSSSQFKGMFSSILTEYYKTYFSYIFSLEGNNDQLIDKIIQFLFVTFEKSNSISTDKLTKYRDLIIQFKDASTAENFPDIVNKLFTTLIVFVKDPNRFIKNFSMFRCVVDPLQISYDKVFGGRDAGNVAIQELIFPSEVIAVGSEIGNNKNIINGIFRLL